MISSSPQSRSLIFIGKYTVFDAPNPEHCARHFRLVAELLVFELEYKQKHITESGI